MSMSFPIHFFGDGASDVDGIESLPAGGERADEIRHLLGGKGSSLHLMSAMGFNVPPGFTLGTPCCRAWFDAGERWPSGLRDRVREAVLRLESITGRSLGSGDGSLRVAVRSGAAESMPGMMDTLLDVDSIESILDAAEQVFRSWRGERAVAYRRERGLVGLDGTAVTVQAMCPADSAGVAFSVDPDELRKDDEIVIEAVRGLGERLVSGAVTPDRYRVGRGDLVVRETVARNEQPVLDGERLRELADTVLRLEDRLGHAVDVEWGIASGELFLLQARRVRRGAPAASDRRRDLVAAEVARLRPRLEHTPFVRHNLDTTLKHPTPLTWELYEEFFRGGGGFLAMYRDLGFTPANDVVEDGFLRLFCGRVYADLDRTARLFYGTGFYRHDPEAVRRRPELLDEPPTARDPSATPLTALRTAMRSMRAARRVERVRRDFLRVYERRTLVRWLAWCATSRRIDLAALGDDALLASIDDHVERVIHDFPRRALKLSLLGGIAHAELADFLERHLGEERAVPAAAALLAALDGDIAVECNLDLARLGRGELDLGTFLSRHGHRGREEMDLARPRWAEDPAAVLRLASSLAGDAGRELEARHGRSRVESLEEARRVRDWLTSERGPDEVARFDELLREARELLPWRETWKHHWMIGMAALRRLLLELDRRWRLDGQVFYLQRAELRELVERRGRVSADVRERLRERRAGERTARTIEPPVFLAADTVDAFLAGDGDAHHARSEGHMTPWSRVIAGTPLAGGRGGGRVWVCADPGDAPSFDGPFVLVCGSTDPAWTPLLARAAALIVERGGALSHGAIVCRDFGVPAVSLPGARELLEDGEPVTVDGERGEVVRAAGGDRVDESPGAVDDEGTAPPLPAEPYVPPVGERLGRRVAAGLAAAIAVSIAIVAVPPISGAVTPFVELLFDWTLNVGPTTFWSVAGVAGLAAILGVALQLTAADPALLRAMRCRLRWYREQIRLRRRSGTFASTVETLRRRMRQASSERTLELLRPIGWSFVPFCLAVLWIQQRFPAEPVSPGTRFAVTAFVRPDASDRYLRYARLDAPSGLRVVDEPYRRLEPNRESPRRAPYRASWTVEALEEGLRTVAVTVRERRVERRVLVTHGRWFAAEQRQPGTSPDGTVEIEIVGRPVAVELPEPAFRALGAVVEWATGGKLTPRQAASPPLVTFLVLAVVFALLLQRIAGLR